MNMDGEDPSEKKKKKKKKTKKQKKKKKKKEKRKRKTTEITEDVNLEGTVAKGVNCPLERVGRVRDESANEGGEVTLGFKGWGSFERQN